MIIHNFFIISIIVVNLLLTFIWGIFSEKTAYSVYADNHVNENNIIAPDDNTTEVLPPLENLEENVPSVIPADNPITDIPATPEAEIVPTPPPPPVATPAAETQPPASSSSSSQANKNIGNEKEPDKNEKTEEKQEPANTNPADDKEEEKKNASATTEPKKPPPNTGANKSSIKVPTLPILASVYDYANNIPLNLNLALSALGINFLLAAGALATKRKRKAQQTTTYRPWQFLPQLRKS